MNWWIWIIAGLIMLGVELFVPLDFYFIFIGLALIITGLLTAVGVLATAGMQWSFAAILGLVLVFIVRKRLFSSLHAKSGTVHNPIEGQPVTIVADIIPGATGRAESRGSSWSVQNKTQQTLLAGQSYTVSRRDGIVLIIDSI